MQKENFQYIPERVVTKLRESKDSVMVEAHNFTKQQFTYTASHVVCTAGSLNTVRILLKSLDLYNTKINITSKAHIITPCIDLRFLGEKENPEKHSLCQLILESTRKINGFSASYSQIYTYKSLLLFKLLNFSPLSAPESLAFLALLTPSLILADSRFPGTFHHTKTCSLVKTTSEERFTIEYSTSEEEKTIIKKEMKIVLKGLRKLGLIPLQNVPLPEGSSAHYAGGVPMTVEATGPLSADINGKLHGSQRIYVGDASLWRAIPSKPPTLTIMANANRIGTNLAQNIQNTKI
jgi:choline dehydrogenase-like flavoprotein